VKGGIRPRSDAKVALARIRGDARINTEIEEPAHGFGRHDAGFVASLSDDRAAGCM